jgi:hypothetical protein
MRFSSPARGARLVIIEECSERMLTVVISCVARERVQRKILAATVLVSDVLGLNRRSQTRFLSSPPVTNRKRPLPGRVVKAVTPPSV